MHACRISLFPHEKRQPHGVPRGEQKALPAAVAAARAEPPSLSSRGLIRWLHRRMKYQMDKITNNLVPLQLVRPAAHLAQHLQPNPSSHACRNVVKCGTSNAVNLNR